MNKNTLIQYVRKNGLPVGVVVATMDRKKTLKMGWSLCCKRDRWNRNKAKLIALNRAWRGSDVKIPDSVMPTFDELHERATRYFFEKIKQLSE